MSKDLAASVRARLLNIAKAEGTDFNQILVRYALERETLNPGTLALAIAATFSRRGMAVPTTFPIGLTDQFADDASRQALWRAFLNKNKLPFVPLPAVITKLRAKLRTAFDGTQGQP